MRGELRRIAVHVTEPEAGWFAWVLTESVDDTWSELATAEEWVASYREAMADGLLALQGLVDDLDQGPRRPPSANTARERPAPSKPGTAPAGHFGFGDLP